MRHWNTYQSPAPLNRALNFYPTYEALKHQKQQEKQEKIELDFYPTYEALKLGLNKTVSL